MKLTWDDAEELAIELMEAYPETDPLTVSFTNLHRWVTATEAFDDAQGAAGEAKLERIQMAWLEEHKEREK